MPPEEITYRVHHKLMAGVLLAALLCFAGLGFHSLVFGQGNPRQSAAAKILELLRDEKVAADQKCGALAKVRGTLSGEEAATVASWLEKAEGQLFVAIATAMVRCGASARALSICEAIASRAESPIDQWGPAMRCIELIGIGAPPGSEAASSAKKALAWLLRRLRYPSGKDQLIQVLMARETVWHPANAWVVSDEVFQQLCELLKHDSEEVRALAAMVLTQAQALQRFSSSVVIVGLAKVLADGSATDPTPVNDLLRRLLGLGSHGKTPEEIKDFWTGWLRKEGKGFRLALHALERAKSSAGMARWERDLLARQVSSSITELPREDCAGVWAAMRKIFEQDTAPPGERCLTWLYPLVLMASRDECRDIRGEAVSMLIKMAEDENPILRERALAQIGNLPGTTGPGSHVRGILDRVLRDRGARPEERAMAAWSLRHAARTEPALVGQIVALAESFRSLPDDAFTTMSRTYSIGQLCAALMEATGARLSLDPSGWRRTLADFLPLEK